MTVKEAFNIWKQEEAYKGFKCIYGGLEGGPGFLDFGSCKHNAHPNVRYGWKTCPNDCLDFQEVTENQLYRIFLSLYKAYPTYYNKQYNIDVGR